MARRMALLVAVALVVSMSGCSVLLGDAVSPTPTPEPTAGTQAADDQPREPTATPSTMEPSHGTATTTPTGSPAEDYQYESFDATALNADHVDALETAGSFTRESSLVIRNGSATRYINGSYAVEAGGPAANTANITYVVNGDVEDLPTTTRYTEGGTTYERQVERTDGGTETRYRKGTEPYDESDPVPVNATVAYSLGQIARDVIDNSAWNETGTGQLEGVDVTRYDTTGERFDVSLAASVRGAATIVVDENGVVRYVAYRFVAETGGEQAEYVYEAGYTDVGSTTVEEPAWTDET